MFIYLAFLVILLALLASLYQYRVLKTFPKPQWVYKIHYGALFAFSYIIIQSYSAAAFLTIATCIVLITKAYDHLQPADREIALVTETSRDIWLFLTIFWFFRMFIYDYSPVPSGSMEPTLLAGDLIAINKTSYQAKMAPILSPLYQFSSPKPGDIVVFNAPKPHDQNEYWIKRVIAVGGDHVAYRNKQYFVNGKAYEQTGHHLVSVSGQKLNSAFIQATEVINGKAHAIQIDNNRFDIDFEMNVPENSYFVSGDNRDYSYDSRKVGAIPADNIVGKATHLLTHFTLPQILSFKRTGWLY